MVRWKSVVRTPVENFYADPLTQHIQQVFFLGRGESENDLTLASSGIGGCTGPPPPDSGGVPWLSRIAADVAV